MKKETHCIAIQIVGTTDSDGNTFHDELSALFERLRELIPETMPTFKIAQGAPLISTFELQEPSS